MSVDGFGYDDDALLEEYGFAGMTREPGQTSPCAPANPNVLVESGRTSYAAATSNLPRRGTSLLIRAIGLAKALASNDIVVLNTFLPWYVRAIAIAQGGFEILHSYTISYDKYLGLREIEGVPLQVLYHANRIVSNSPAGYWVVKDRWQATPYRVNRVF